MRPEIRSGSELPVRGAGSAVFSLGLIRDLCRTPGLPGSTVAFVDP
jgi:alpha-galactosidase